MKWSGLLAPKNGHQSVNRAKALAFAITKIPEIEVIDKGTIKLEPYGVCHFSAFTDPAGAMISTPNRDDNKFGSAPWHRLDCFAMFRDFGDGRVIIYFSPIQPLFEHRDIGHHGVTWEQVKKISGADYRVFRIS